MIRPVGILIGLVFTIVVLTAFGNGLYTWLTDEPAATAETVFHEHPEKAAYSFEGAFGRWDNAQLQRGYKVYEEVCAACHSMHYVAFRDLQKIGFNEDEVKALAAKRQVPGIDPATGEATTRPGLPTDYFPSPYPNNVAAAAANGGAIPPDLSLITKARHDGVNYVHSLLTGYKAPPAALAKQFPDFTVPNGKYYNPYFASLAIGMPPPLTSEGQVTYDDETPATVEQMSKDVSAFLAWTAEPSMVKRKQTGWAVLGFVLFATLLALMAYKQIWAGLKPKKYAKA